jgi:hypothetical protein
MCVSHPGAPLTSKVAAKALAIGIGDLTSAGVCVYGLHDGLNDDCPISCKGLITATWGDCYCRNPQYKPDTVDVDDILAPMDVHGLFAFINGSSSKYGTKWNATCRSWIGQEAETKMWMCS